MFKGMSLCTEPMAGNDNKIDYELCINGTAEHDTLAELLEIVSTNQFKEEDLRRVRNRKSFQVKFGGIFFLDGKKVWITKVIYNAPATIVFWSDNTKTTAKCQEVDQWNSQVGLLTCVMKKLTGSDNTIQLVEHWVPENNAKEDQIDLKTVRKLNKNKRR